MEAIDRARGGRRPTAGQHEPLRHTARNDGTDRRRQGDTRADGHALSTDGARGARKKAATGRRKPAAFVPKQAAFFVAAGARRQKAEKHRETTDAITERTKTLTPHHRIISKNTFSRRALSGKCRPKFARFVGLEGNRGRSIHLISSIPKRITKKESTTHRRMRHKLCIFTLRPTHFVQSSNDCPRRRSKSTLCHFASWDTMGKKRSLRVRNSPFFVQV